jgi:hypothetical protein
VKRNIKTASWHRLKWRMYSGLKFWLLCGVTSKNQSMSFPFLSVCPISYPFLNLDVTKSMIFWKLILLPIG